MIISKEQLKEELLKWLRIALRWQPDGRQERLVLKTAWLCLAVAFVCTAWIGDDAYITFRVLDNFIHGYGLRWNVGERVQAYTNPLWLFLHAPFYLLWHNIFLLTLLISAVCAIASVAIAAHTFPRQPAAAAFYLIAPLLFARPWREYAVSGLENPLSYLLFAWFGWALFHANDDRRWFRLSFITALAMLNRLDLIIAFAPPVLWQALQSWRAVNWRQVAAGFLPLIAWLLFSLFYYGFLFPNTKYAKLDTGVSEVAYLRQGGYYLYDMAMNQGLTSLMLLAGIAAGGWAGWRSGFGQKQGILFSVALGIVSYGTFIFIVGGDFMSGRFFALPAFMAIWLMYGMLPSRLPLACGVCALCGLFLLQHLFDLNTIDLLESGIANEKGFYESGTTLLRHGGWTPRLHPEWQWLNDGRQWRKFPPPDPTVLYNIGMSAYAAGPAFIGIDELGLADPLLARLPVSRAQPWRIGHFQRDIPPGYIEAVKTGSLRHMPPNLAKYYEKLHLITSGDLWCLERIETIFAFNFGVYDHWRDTYVQFLNKASAK